MFVTITRMVSAPFDVAAFRRIRRCQSDRRGTNGRVSAFLSVSHSEELATAAGTRHFVIIFR